MTIIDFNNIDLPLIGVNHNKAFYIIMSGRHKYIPMTVVDNGSSINVCSPKMAKKLA